MINNSKRNFCVCTGFHLNWILFPFKIYYNPKSHVKKISFLYIYLYNMQVVFWWWFYREAEQIVNCLQLELLFPTEFTENRIEFFFIKIFAHSTEFCLRFNISLGNQWCLVCGNSDCTKNRIRITINYVKRIHMTRWILWYSSYSRKRNTRNSLRLVEKLAHSLLQAYRSKRKYIERLPILRHF